jgi:hypothetical protein
MAAGEGGGAAAGPFVGERVPREGERATVERFRDGALWPVSARRRCGRENPRWFGFCLGASLSPFPFSDQGLGLRFILFLLIRVESFCSFLVPNKIHNLARL